MDDEDDAFMGENCCGKSGFDNDSSDDEDEFVVPDSYNEQEVDLNFG